MKLTAGFCVVFAIALVLGGCESLRFAPDESQKQNAWLHYHTTRLTAETAGEEACSEQLRDLADLSHEQSRAFVAYCGLPEEMPAAETPEDVLAPASRGVTESANQSARRRPDPWTTADAFLELGIGIAGILGGVYGLRAAEFLTRARDKTAALREIIEGNEALRNLGEETRRVFKEAHQGQSARTRRIVAETKAAAGL